MEGLSDSSGYLLLLKHWCVVVTHCAILRSCNMALIQPQAQYTLQRPLSQGPDALSPGGKAVVSLVGT